MQEMLSLWLSHPLAGKIMTAAAGIVAIYIVVRLLRHYLSLTIKDADTRYRLRKFISFLGYMVAVLFIFSAFSKSLSGLHVAFGIVGAGVALSLQEVILSIAGWIALSTGSIYNPGDRIRVSGIKGDVIDIGILRTTVMECGEWVNGDQHNGRIVRVSNSAVLKEPVFNYSAEFPFLWDEIKLPIRYGSDVGLTREILSGILDEVIGEYTMYAKESWEKILKKYLIEAAQVEPQVMMTANENWMDFTLRYVVDYKARRRTKDRLFSRALEEFERTGGRVSVASTSVDISIKETPQIDVRLGKEGQG